MVELQSKDCAPNSFRLRLTMNDESLTNVDASNCGDPTSPSHVLNHFSADGKTPSFRASKIRGASVAKKVSSQGNSSTHFATVGNVSLRESIAVSDEMNATGIDQKKHKDAVATKLNKLPVFFALSGKPTLGQNIPSGGGAGSTTIALATKRVRSPSYSRLPKFEVLNSPAACWSICLAA